METKRSDFTSLPAFLAGLSHHQLTIRCRQGHVDSKGTKLVLINNLVGLAQQELEEAELTYDHNSCALDEVRVKNQQPVQPGVHTRTATIGKHPRTRDDVTHSP